MGAHQSLRSNLPFDIVITGGGTGGHVYPGIAVAKEVKRQFPSASVLFIGTQKGLESKIIPYEGFALKTVDIRGFAGKGVTQRLRAFWKLPFAVLRARHYLKEFRPHVVFGTGGYVSVPVLYAAYLLHIPTLTLEPNRRPGLANKLLSKSVDQIAICFEESAAEFPEKKVIFTGNPIRKEFSIIGKTSPPNKGEKCNILVVGGSLGASSLNHAMIEALDYLVDYRDHFVFTHQTGASSYNDVKAGYEQKGFRTEVLEYIDDIPKMYARSHLIICRAGASTVAELQASRRPAILIPYAHGDRHQEFNAQALVDKGIAKMILQKNLSGETLSKVILECLYNPDTVAQVWVNVHSTNEKSAAERIVDVCLELARIWNSPHRTMAG
ncbi:undecaprenyldiphospho-muramoylpentapeptide beta-N-acetylglucosaminyltransferase [candidate division KSB3 bacterium]|uniref:UDP-N-acetylglucosamine--N-acetylmuramyl-(pentapeptide) pyrophosphoryl-undecaprenol N-acetylglucosamine transferase n=1 Tax=candidate division KSB3 bacterium TaxID=2044937 RepID=A0A2G6KAI5_9BACT|nr:MAG: undecaprenyldiphospho-muramoylpentapeptide beta-N-acetylglucosaminyltransferase [candidate division KSB3 bacterium]